MIQKTISKVTFGNNRLFRVFGLILLSKIIENYRFEKGRTITIGALYKTKGFMSEIESHDAHFRLNAGLVVRQ